MDQLNQRARHALMGNLGIQYTYASEDRVEATMPVDERTRQPFGILHGGATLALAETVAGLGSMILCKPDEIVVGMQVSGNHISSAHEGDTVRAVASIVHKGRSSHVWNVDVFTSTAKLVSSIRVVNSILKKDDGYVRTRYLCRNRPVYKTSDSFCHLSYPGRKCGSFRVERSWRLLRLAI